MAYLVQDCGISSALAMEIPQFFFYWAMELFLVIGTRAIEVQRWAD